MNTDKQQAIINAYGDYYEDIKDTIIDNGWCIPTKDLLDCISMDTKEFHMVFGSPDIYYRPKSLRGIETNNGWIKIESEADLPEQGGDYDIVINGVMKTGVYCKNNKWMVESNDYTKTTQEYQISHYKPIVKPNPPIY
jgi:hypothetical protein